jgi:amidophosphoribosyltransferase
MKVLLSRIRTLGKAREIHVRVACPPIIAPCFYGIDMSTVGELFAPQFMREGQSVDQMHQAMADALGADSVRYLPVESIARAVQRDPDQLCRACITGDYPTSHGQKLYQIALSNSRSTNGAQHEQLERTYEG